VISFYLHCAIILFSLLSFFFFKKLDFFSLAYFNFFFLAKAVFSFDKKDRFRLRMIILPFVLEAAYNYYNKYLYMF